MADGRPRSVDALRRRLQELEMLPVDAWPIALDPWRTEIHWPGQGSVLFYTLGETAQVVSFAQSTLGLLLPGPPYTGAVEVAGPDSGYWPVGCIITRGSVTSLSLFVRPLDSALRQPVGGEGHG